MIKKNKGFKFRLKPTGEQIKYFEKAFGCTRKMYNIYVDLLCKQLEQQEYKNGKIKNISLPTPATIKKDYSYMKEIDSLAFANVQLDFQEAIRKFNKEYDGKTYKKKTKKQEKTTSRELTFKDLKGFPSYKSKKKNHNSFTTNNQNGTVAIIDEKYVRIPKLKSLIRFVNHRQIPNGYTIKGCTISKDYRGKYYISFLCEYFEEVKKIEPKTFIGLDYSQDSFYVDSEGERANYPQYYKKLEEKIKKEQRKLSRKKLNSNNWLKQKRKISKLQHKIANQRLDWLHKKSYEIANQYDAVVVEDIDLRNMAQCLSLGKKIHDNGFGIFRNLLQYKLEDRGKMLIKIDKWFPSSKICHCCGYKNEQLELSDREWTCDNCGEHHDRDVNAAINIREEGKRVA
jgi:putative transposase